MPANIDTMIYVGETPWHGLGVNMTDNPPMSVEAIIDAANLGWEVDTSVMRDEKHDRVKNYHSIYRTDSNAILGIVNKEHPNLVQNREMFNSLGGILNDVIRTETAASLGLGETVFGCFKINEDYDIIGDEVEHYYVVVNDHTRADGKITVINTPVRVVCQNTLTYALSNNLRKMRVPVSSDPVFNRQVADQILDGAVSSINNLDKLADTWATDHINDTYVNNVLDHLFPYKYVNGEVLLDRANERIQMIRDTFMTNCMNADNVNNFRNTKWQVFNALTDFEQHYHKKVDNVYDLKHRMSTIPGVVAAGETSLVAKYIQIADKIAA